MEPFLPGESVALTDADHSFGRIVGVSDDGATVEVRWLRCPGHEHDLTLEPASVVRRVHESEEGML